MSQEIINIGTSPNDGAGDPLRVAFQKINNNFTQLYTTSSATYTAVTLNNDPNQVILEIPISTFTQATLQINSANPDTNDSQNIILVAAIYNNDTDVGWTGRNTIFIGDPVVSAYDINVNGTTGNVEVTVSPTINSTLNHLINAQIGHYNVVPGTPLGIDGGAAGDVLGTENKLIITTETPA